MERTKKKVSGLRIFGRVCLGILGVLLLLILLLLIVPLTEKAETVSVDGSESWMASLPNFTLLNDIAIPGTHDSATEYSQMDFFAKCQSTSIAQQLYDGFRYLDIRLAVTTNPEDNSDALGFMHGFIKCQKSALPWSKQLLLDSVLADCYDFLDNNPSECIIFAVKQEYGDESVAQFQALLDSYISQAPEYWYTADEIPTLGEARGKLVLLRRYEDEAGLGENAGAALIWSSQSGYEDSSLSFATDGCIAGDMQLYVQDRYEYTSDEKWAAFTSSTGAENKGVTINFLSTKGHATFGHPYSFAKNLNNQLLNLDDDSIMQNSWTVIDFGNAALAQKIYEVNFK